MAAWPTRELPGASKAIVHFRGNARSIAADDPAGGEVELRLPFVEQRRTPRAGRSPEAA
jgi:hypothetical protein